MQLQDLQPLPLGRSTFEALRTVDSIYVDKTEQIFSLASTDGKYFLARPRRFGKTLLVFALESLFKDGLKYFSGLKISKLWNDHTYPVVRLDFSSLKTYGSNKKFVDNFHNLLLGQFAQAGFEYQPQSPVKFIYQLKTWLLSLPPVSLVILIDEYDAPLTENLHDSRVFQEIRQELAEFYAVIKECDNCLRFFFMTGITKFQSTSIFSSFNNLTDISLDPAYGTLLGYTEEELHHYFGQWIDKAVGVLGTSSRQELIDRMRVMYDGFCFDLFASTHVFCPWSVLSFLNRPDLGLRNYWYDSAGQPTVLVKHLLTHPLDDPKTYEQFTKVRLSDLSHSQDLPSIQTEVLLAQVGYLTIKEALPGDRVLLGYPNREVTVSIARLHSDELLRNQDLSAYGINSVAGVLSDGSVEDVVALFNRLSQAVDYNKHPFRDEATCRGMLYSLLYGADLPVTAEVHNAYGRSDLMVKIGERCWVFELKFAASDDKEQALLEQAVEQVQSRQYGKEQRAKELIRVALVYSAQQKIFSRWQVVP